MHRATLAGFVLLASACGQRVHPWDGQDAAVLPNPAFQAQAPLPPANSAAPPADDAGASEKEEEALPIPVRVGGPWVRCYGGFHPEGVPLRDVTRLSILCGPSNGMRRLSTQTIQGEVRGPGSSVLEKFLARRGDCYRLFAVAEPSVGDLDIVVRSSRGAPVAADHGEDNWPIVQPDRPFCPLDDDTYSVEFSAKRGSGRFAAEIWYLRSADGLPKGDRAWGADPGSSG